MGIAMLADPNFGETEGGLQAPFVMKEGAEYIMFYGTWTHIAIARSKDGKTFARQLQNGESGILGEGPGANTRDPMVLKIGDLFYLYYTAYPNDRGFVFARTSKDLAHWSDPAKKVAFGGSSGSGKYSSECPFVYYHKASGYYYLLRNQRYGQNAQFAVYRSKDPLDFGLDNDRSLVETMPYAAPEIVESEGQTYIAVLLPTLKGIQIAKLKWAPKAER